LPAAVTADQVPPNSRRNAELLELEEVDGDYRLVVHG